MNTPFPVLFIIILLILFSCAAQTSFEPVGKGNMRGNVGIGGPIISAFGARIPVPYLTIGANYGIAERINIHGNLHLFSLGYKIVGFDFGAAWFPLLNEGLSPTISIQPRLLVFASTKSDVTSRFRAYPIFTNTAAWKVRNNMLYTGYDLVIPFSNPDYDSEASSAIFSPFVGYRWNVGERTRLTTELKWHGANIKSDQLAVEYVPIGGYGAITTLFSIERSF